MGAKTVRPSSVGAGGDERTARSRIRDATIRRVARDGVAATTIRAIARDVEVSPGLVIHHFGSKDRLLSACDAYVVGLVSEHKTRVMTEGPAPDLLGAFRSAHQDLPLVGYLARVLVEGSPRADELLDFLVADAVRYLAEGVGAGAVRPSEHHETRAALLTIWNLGALVLNEHVRRVVGVDLTRDLLDQDEGREYLASVGEILLQGVLTDEMAGSLQRLLNGDEPARSATGHGRGHEG